MISPKEKALELWWKYYNRVEHTLSEEYLLHEKELCKNYALIAVDEIIEANPYKWVPFMDQYTETILTSNIPYWQEVKQEIEKIGGDE
jgi:hypothetical protein